MAEDCDSGEGENAQIVFAAWEDATCTVTVADQKYHETGTYKISLSVLEDPLLA